MPLQFGIRCEKLKRRLSKLFIEGEEEQEISLVDFFPSDENQKEIIMKAKERRKEKMVLMRKCNSSVFVLRMREWENRNENGKVFCDLLTFGKRQRDEEEDTRFE